MESHEEPYIDESDLEDSEVEGFERDYAQDIRDRLDHGESPEEIAAEESVDVRTIERLRRRQDVDTYAIFGHGEDVCLPSGELEILPVPEGCVYVSITHCGIPLIDKYNTMYNPYFVQSNFKFFNEPVKYKSKLEEILGTNIHIHHSNSPKEVSRTYVNSNYEPVAKMKRLNNDIQLSDSGVAKFPVTPPRLTKVFKPDVYLTPADITPFFRYSVYPTVQMVTDAVNKTHNFSFVKEIPQITQKELFEKYPGIYYNITCRGVRNACKKQAKTRREQSLGATDFRRNPTAEGSLTYLAEFFLRCARNNTLCSELKKPSAKRMWATLSQADKDELYRYAYLQNNKKNFDTNISVSQVKDMYPDIKNAIEGGKRTRKNKLRNRKTKKKPRKSS